MGRHKNATIPNLNFKRAVTWSRPPVSTNTLYISSVTHTKNNLKKKDVDDATRETTQAKTTASKDDKESIAPLKPRPKPGM